MAHELHESHFHSPKIGFHMPDGTVYAGSLDGKDLYAMPADAPLTYTFNDAANYAAQLNAQEFLGHSDWRVPTKSELNVLFANHAAIGGFNEGGSHHAGWYWSCSVYDSYNYSAWSQRFRDGVRDDFGKGNDSSLRLVR